jgi:hypothetical protein
VSSFYSNRVERIRTHFFKVYFQVTLSHLWLPKWHCWSVFWLRFCLHFFISPYCVTYLASCHPSDWNANILHIKDTNLLPSLSLNGYIVRLSIATLWFSTERSFSTLSPISERRYFVSGWSFMELLPAQYWIFVSMWHCFSRLEFTKRIWWKEP